MKKFLLVFLLMGGMFPVFSQGNKISGKVTGSDDGLPLPGATVSVKGTSTGTQTSNTGEYSISALKGAILEFSFVGYLTQSVTVGNSNEINISLVSDSRILDEVIVSGVAGTTSRKKPYYFCYQSK
ncbi:MAG: carboxypeptidase-like regulatory domain-containing protein [Cytophagaceae bacterium]|nr:carboxypeptidase-like regulatory domain-containing protein [Cytophagaceae bacterium]